MGRVLSSRPEQKGTREREPVHEPCRLHAPRGHRRARPRGRVRRQLVLGDLRPARSAYGRNCGGTARTGLHAGDVRRARDDELPAVLRDAVRRVACRPGGGPRQREAPSERVRLHPRSLQVQDLLRHPGPGREHRGNRRRHRHARCRRVRGRPRLRGDGDRSGHRHGARRTGRPRVAVLHERHHRPPQGGDPDPPRAHGHDHGLLRRHRSRGTPQTRSFRRHRSRTARGCTRCRTSPRRRAT